MQTYSDEYIECWGDVYVANQIVDRGIPFDMFLTTPNEHLQVLFNQPGMSGNGPYPLLPEQIRVLDKIQRAEQVQELIKAGEADHQGNTLELHGDRLVTPIHHHDMPKKWKTNTRRSAS